MKINKSNVPELSLLNVEKKIYDYIDSYSAELQDKNDSINVQNVAKAFFSSSPKWVGLLFILRNKIVSMFGLKTSGSVENRQSQLDNFKFEPGTRLGLFKVFSRNENEIIIGEDDKHLNFRVSLYLEKKAKELHQKILTISTTVEFNNGFGRVYFFPVKPFHKIIVPIMLKGIIKSLENDIVV